MDRISAIEIYKIQHDRFKHTKDLQWKINLSFWTLLVLGIYNAENIGSNLSHYQIIIVTLLFFTAQLIFSFKTQKTLEADKIVNLEILKQLNHDKETNISIDIPRLTKRIKLSLKGIGWISFQVFITSSLLVLWLFILWK